MAGHVLTGAVVGWHLPVLVVGGRVERLIMSRNVVRVVVMMRGVAVGKVAGGFGQAVGIRSRKEWYRHKMSRKQLVSILGQRVVAGGGREVTPPHAL